MGTTEANLIGCLLRNSTDIERVWVILQDDDFEDEDYSRVYQTIKGMYQRGLYVSVDTLVSALEKTTYVSGATWADLLSDCLMYLDYFPDAAVHYATQIREDSVRRKLRRISERITELSRDKALDATDLATRSTEALQELDVRQPNSTAIKDLVEQQWAVIENSIAHPGERRYSIGITDVDRDLMDWLPGNFIVVAGRPGQGKTSLALNIALYRAKRKGESVAIVSLEMSPGEVVNRMLCAEAGVDSRKLERGEVDDDEQLRLRLAKTMLSYLKINIIEDVRTPGEIAMKVRQLRDVDLLVIDYIQLMNSDSRAESRTVEVSQITRRLKLLAKQLNVCILGLAQLSRASEVRADKRPQLSDLRESGSIEQDADAVYFLHPDEQGSGSILINQDALVQFIFGKQRRGPAGHSVQLYFNRRDTVFTGVEITKESLNEQE